MKLLSREKCNLIEELLRAYQIADCNDNTYLLAMDEFIEFFKKDSLYYEFIEKFYFKRHQYYNRFPTNREMFAFLCNYLGFTQSSLYVIRREVIYKAAMLFYKYKVIE